MTGFEIRRAADRAVSSTDWLESAHSFSFGPHYDPDNLSFGPLVAVNSDLVQPGPGYARHRHAGLEILTWVTAGVLEHDGPDGLTRVPAGQLQYLSTGAGLEHAERSASATEPVRVVQMWLTGPADRPPHYQVSVIPDGKWVLAAGEAAPVELIHPVGELYRSVLPAGRELLLPDRALHLFVLRGSITVAGQGGDPETHLSAEDALRGTAASMTATTDAELLVWAFPRPQTGNPPDCVR